MAIVSIAGTSSGIGMAPVDGLAAQGHDLGLVALLRNGELLN